MEEHIWQKRYQAPYKYLRIGEREYAVLDKALAAERASHHLALAKEMLAEEKPDANQQKLINKELILATDFGSTEAPFLFALRILDKNIPTHYPLEDIAVFLKIAAERGHAEAAYRMACSYGALSLFVDIEEAAVEYFNSFDALERCRLAEYYFDKAILQGHQCAIEELIIAYAYGRGHIKKDVRAFTKLCESQCRQHNQMVMLGYGAWLLGMTVEGKELSTDSSIPVDFFKGLEYLLLASKGQHLEKAEHALHLICISINRDLWGSHDKQQLYKILIGDAVNGNQLLALYLAWYSIPPAQRNRIPEGLFERYQLNELAVLVRDNEQDVLAYLDIALFGKDEDVSSVAREILSHVFSQHLDIVV